MKGETERDLKTLIEYCSDEKELIDFEDNAVPEYKSKAKALAKSDHVYAAALRLRAALRSKDL